jgi:hypothetical protein
MRYAPFAAIATALLLAPSVQAQVVLPKLCRPCLFYGGDISPDDQNTEAFPNGMTLTTNDETYIAVHIPANRTVLVEGLLVQTIIERGDGLDPKQASYEILSDVVTGKGGTLVAFNVVPAAVQPTGRQFAGFPEYTVAVKLDPPVQLSGGKFPGTVYWLNVQPQCTNPKNPYCQTVTYLESNSSLGVNSLHVNTEYYADNDFYWPQKDYIFEPCVDTGLNGNQCSLSFGIMGTIVQ